MQVTDNANQILDMRLHQIANGATAVSTEEWDTVWTELLANVLVDRIQF